MSNELIDKLINDVNKTNLLNDVVINSQEYQILSKYLIKKYSNKNIELISFEEFKIVIQNLVVLIMKEYLKNTKFKYDGVSCDIKKYFFSACFLKNTNQLTISSSVIKRLYDGDIIELEIIFHELYHFVMKYEVLNNNIDFVLVKCLKDNLLALTSFIYYIDNYPVLAFENIIDCKAIIELNNYLSYNNIALLRKDKRKIEYAFKQNIKYYYNNRRSMEECNKCIKYDDLFEKSISMHPEWLNYYQIGIEYYMNKEGFVVRRDKEELTEMLNIELENGNNLELIHYLEELIKDKDKKMHFCINFY